LTIKTEYTQTKQHMKPTVISRMEIRKW